MYTPGVEFERFLPGIYFILECHLDRVSSERDRPTKRLNYKHAQSHGKTSLHGCYFGVDATNAGDKEICLPEVKNGGEYERGYRCSSIDFYRLEESERGTETLDECWSTNQPLRL